MNDGVIVGVPGHYGWQEVPGSPFEVGVFPQDRYPGFRFRWNEAAAAAWFRKMLEDYSSFIGWTLRNEGWIE